MTQKWDRFRFYANLPDYRPIIWPPLGPYWCSGCTDNFSVIVAYFPHGTTENKLKEFWPEANNIELMQSNIALEFSSRFPEPEWWSKSKIN